MGDAFICGECERGKHTECVDAMWDDYHFVDLLDAPPILCDCDNCYDENDQRHDVAPEGRADG